MSWHMPEIMLLSVEDFSAYFTGPSVLNLDIVSMSRLFVYIKTACRRVDFTTEMALIRTLALVTLYLMLDKRLWREESLPATAPNLLLLVFVL